MEEPSEQFTLELTEHPGYLKVSVRAEVWTPAMADRYNRELAEALAGKEHPRVLIFRDIPVTLRLVAVFSLMSDFVDGVGRRKIAVVNPFPELTEDLKFTVRIATNRGGEYRLFNSIPDAEKWLLK